VDADGAFARCGRADAVTDPCAIGRINPVQMATENAAAAKTRRGFMWHPSVS
jgi:hypothetical protein